MLNAAALRNIYNYPMPGIQEELAIPTAQQGPAIPIFGEMTTQAWLSKLKAVAEDQTIGGLKMARPTSWRPSQFSAASNGQCWIAACGSRRTRNKTSARSNEIVMA